MLAVAQNTLSTSLSPGHVGRPLVHVLPKRRLRPRSVGMQVPYTAAQGRATSILGRGGIRLGENVRCLRACALALAPGHGPGSGLSEGHGTRSHEENGHEALGMARSRQLRRTMYMGSPPCAHFVPLLRRIVRSHGAASRTATRRLSCASTRHGCSRHHPFDGRALLVNQPFSVAGRRTQ